VLEDDKAQEVTKRQTQQLILYCTFSSIGVDSSNEEELKRDVLAGVATAVGLLSAPYFQEQKTAFSGR